MTRRHLSPIGRLVWLLDGYTTTDRYPYSDPVAGMGNYRNRGVPASLPADERARLTYQKFIKDYYRVLLGVDEPAWTAEDKGALAASSGADIVDCETHALARWVKDAGVAWGVVRGVSDGPLDELPREAIGWMDAGGTTKPLTVVRDLALRPSLFPRVRHLMRGTNGAMRRVAHGVDRLLHVADLGDVLEDDPQADNGRGARGVRARQPARQG